MSDTLASNKADGGISRGKICLVSHDPGVQGAERAMLDMAVFLKGAGWDVTVLIPSETGGLAELIDMAGLPRKTIPYYYWIGPGRLKGKAMRILSNVISLPRLISFFRKTGFSAIYTHSTATGTTAIAAKLAGIPHIWHMHEYGPYEEGDRKITFDMGERLTLGLMRWTKSTYVAVAHVIKNTFEHRLEGSDIRVVYQPVPFNADLAPEDDEAVAKIRALPGKKIIYVGAVVETKRQEDAIRALPDILAKYPDATLVLGGRVEEKYGAKMRELAEDLGVARSILYLGYLRNAPAVIGLCDISINCRLAEASPRVLVESMMARTAVLAANAGGNVESLSDETGLLYAATDHNDLAAKAIWLFGHPKETAQLVETAYKRSNSERNVEIYAKNYVALIEDAIASAQSAD